MEDNTTNTLIEIRGQIQHIVDGIDTIKEKQILLAEDISRIKEAVYHPDVGLYARLRELDTRLKTMESFRTNTTRFMWIVVVAGVSMFFAIFQKQIM
tara:strand:- start:10424 stop:10714 length:291 start_codon:yes stop_codon:yes gene_type:complete